MDKRLHEVSLIIPAHPQLQVEMERVFATYGVFKAAVLEIKSCSGSMKAPRWDLYYIVFPMRRVWRIGTVLFSDSLYWNRFSLSER